MPGEFFENALHRPVEVDCHHLAAKRRLVDFGQEPGRVVLELLDEHAIAGDLAERLAVGRAGNSDADWQRRAMTRQADDAHVVAEILAPELGADAEILGELVDFRLEREVAEGAPVRRRPRRQRVKIVGRGELDGLQVELGGEAPDHDGQVIGRAGGCAQRQDLLLQEGDDPVVGQDRRRRLEQKGLVGRAAALGHEQKLVGVLALGGDVDLRRQVVAGVRLLESRKRRELAVAQVLLGVGLAEPSASAASSDPSVHTFPALLGDDNGGAGVLAHWQDAAGGDAGVLQKVVGDELVVAGRLGVVEDFR